MGSEIVDQIGPDGALIQDIDTTLSPSRKRNLLREALPGARLENYAGQHVMRFQDQVILTAQVTHLGRPWEVFKKRIQIPRHWLDVERQGRVDGLTVRFVGVYHHGETTIFVDFDPTTYVRRKANNSAAHVSTNDLFQAQTLGQFSREDKNGNRLISVRADLFADYLRGRTQEQHPYLDVFDRFNAEFLQGDRLDALDTVREMHAVSWPDRYQGEWAGFYLEYRMDEFLKRSRAERLVAFQKAKRRDDFDYDLVFMDGRSVAYFGDLKASNRSLKESPGNDGEDIRRCIAEFGRFWYVIYEHDTWHSRDEGDLPVIAWNEWKRSVGFVNGKMYNPRSYAQRFKSSVRFSRMMILEINEANFNVVLDDFNQGQQQSGAARAQKVKITKKNIDNFLIYTKSIDVPAMA